jgi:predicted ribosomally synthesized peptide with nif11-like leader
MSEEQLAALLSRLNDDALLREKFQNAPDLDTAVALAEEAGFKVSKADWLKFQASDNLELSDEDLEGVAGGGSKNCHKETNHNRPECQQPRQNATK